jgi:hypothetical protein
MSGSIHWRIDHQGTHDLQIEIGPDTTVGEVAAALAADVSPAGHPPRPVGGNVPPDAAAPLTLATAGRVIHPGRAAHEAAPRSGSTVRLHRFDGEARPDLDGVEAPVVLRRGPATRRLCFGANAVHPGVVVEVAHDVRVRARGADPVVLDGVTVHGEAVVPHGGLLRLGEWTASVEVHGDLRPPPRSGPWRTHAPRRGPWPSPPGGRVELPAPPDPGRLPGLPWLSMAVPLAMAVAIWAASGSLLWSGFMAVSVGYVVAAAIESRHEARAERRFRTARFRRELARVEEELSRLSADEHESDQLVRSRVPARVGARRRPPGTAHRPPGNRRAPGRHRGGHPWGAGHPCRAPAAGGPTPPTPSGRRGRPGGRRRVGHHRGGHADRAPARRRAAPARGARTARVRPALAAARSDRAGPVDRLVAPSPAGSRRDGAGAGGPRRGVPSRGGGRAAHLAGTDHRRAPWIDRCGGPPAPPGRRRAVRRPRSTPPRRNPRRDSSAGWPSARCAYPCRQPSAASGYP